MADDYDPLDPPTFNAANEPYDLNNDIVTEQQVAEGDDDDDYEPGTFPPVAASNTSEPTETQLLSAVTAANTASKPVSRSGSAMPNASEQAAKPNTTAGFILEESDEEDTADDDDDASASQLNGATDAPLGLDLPVVSQAHDVSLGSAPTQDLASAVPSAQQTVSLNGSAATLPVSAPVPSVVSSTPFNPTPSQSNPTAPPGASEPTNTIALAVNGGASAIAKTASPTVVSSQSTLVQRLPHDKVGQLEDRIKDDPRADTAAWMALIAHYREKEQLDNLRNTYDRFLEVFPTAAPIWLEYLNLEQDQDDHRRIDALLNRCLVPVPNVELWQFYLNVLRRRHPLMNDAGGKNRSIISQAFDFALDKVGLDPDAGNLWREYIDFQKSGPGTVGATGWQDMQKVDFLRQAYRKSVALPNDEVIKLWKEYDNFELTLNRATGRKFLNERSPHYMTAKAAKTQLDEILHRLNRKTLPSLPPLPGCQGDIDFGNQLQAWRAWIAWEKNDELVLKQDGDIEGYRKRVLYAYKQAVMSLAFYPEIWFDAAGWCFEQNTDEWRKEGNDFLDQGVAANPESALLALRKADVLEASFKGKGDSDGTAVQNGERLDAVFEHVHTALYALKKKYQERESKANSQVQDHFSSLPPEDDTDVQGGEDDDEDDDERPDKPKSRTEQLKEQTQAIKIAADAQHEILKRTISYVWVAKLRAFNRVQGQGARDKAKKGLRGVFTEARPRGLLTSDVYIAAALMEHHCYGDIAAARIFERGLKLFPNDEVFVLEYIMYLVAKQDLTNAKALFETTITKIEKNESFSKDQRRAKCRPLLSYMHQHESNYGDLAAIQKIENRMAEMYPEEPEILRFGHRFAMPTFDALKVQLVLSPLQTRPKLAPEMVLEPPQQALASIEEPRGSPQTGQILLGPHGPYIASPKRPLDDSDDGTPSRKFLRGESPLKGAAGRRIATSAGTTTIATGVGGGGGGFVTKSYIPSTAMQTAQAAPLPRELTSVLSILPPASSYKATTFDPAKMVELFRSVNFAQFGR